MDARTERRAMIALVAVFALLVQALLPAMARAAPPPDSATVICTQAGAAPVRNPNPEHPPADHACKQCLCPALASTPPPVAHIEPVAYVETAAPRTTTPHTLHPPARAPPRPPGQGPPSSNA